MLPRAARVTFQEVAWSRARRPRQGSSGRCRRGAPLLHDEIDRRLSFAVVVVVEIESSSETEAAVEWKCADERSGRVTALMQHRRDRGVLGVENEAGVFANAVLKRIKTGEDVRV